MHRIRARALRCAAFGLVVLGGCAPPAGRPKAPIFIPPPPDKPRLQLLLTLSSEKDLRPPPSRMLALLGKKTRESAVSKPYGVAVRGTKIYITDAGPHSVVVINLAKKKFQTLEGGAHPAAQTRMPINLAFDDEGHLYVTDTGRWQVLHFDANERFVSVIGDGKSFKPSGVAVHKNLLYVSDLSKHQVLVFDRRTGKELRRFGKQGEAQGELWGPANLTADTQGNIYASEAFTGRVQKFSPEGKLLHQFGQLGSRVGDLVRPKGMGVDWQGNLYVADAASEMVQLWNRAGRLLLFFGGNRGTEDSLYLPAGVCITYDPEFLRLLRPRVAAGHEIEYALLVANQYGAHKISIFGFLR